MSRIAALSLCLIGLISFGMVTHGSVHVAPDPDVTSAPSALAWHGDLYPSGLRSAPRAFLSRAPSFEVHALPLEYRGDGDAISLASCDFDEDGVPDLVTAHTVPEGSVLALQHGDPSLVVPWSSPVITHLAFDSRVDLYPTPVSRPDFLGAGDFDNDGHCDVVVAARGGDRLHLLAGDGNGGFRPTQAVRVPGTVTTITTGDINRRDILTDVIVGIDSPEGPALLVFESPTGALTDGPEIIPLPAPAGGLALGQLDDDPAIDLAVAAGRKLVIVHGRDRRLSLVEQQQAEVGPPLVEAFELPASAHDVACGDFVWEPDRRIELATIADDGSVYILGRSTDGPLTLLAQRQVDSLEGDAVRPRLVQARVSGSLTDDLLVLDLAARALHVVGGTLRQDANGNVTGDVHVETSDVEGWPTAILGLRLNRDALTDFILLREGVDAPLAFLTAPRATITVDSASDGGLPGDGTCSLREAINNSNFNSDTTAGDCTAGSGVDAIEFSIGGGGAVATIPLLSALPAISDPVLIDGASQGCVAPPCIELDGSGAGVGSDGLTLTAGSSTVSGLVLNGFDGRGIVIESSGGNYIEGNFIGTDVAGMVAVSNASHGIFVTSSDNTFGGNTPGALNLLSGNGGAGIRIDGNLATGNHVLGNFAGVALDGKTGLGNTAAGVALINGASNNTVGGTGPGARNVTSDNGKFGVALPFGPTANVVLGNIIGTDVGGTIPLGNTQSGVLMEDAPGNTIGTPSPGGGNLISGNVQSGIYVPNAPSTSNLIQNNRVGTDITGTAALGNTFDGISLYQADGNTIGGAVPLAGNLVSGNLENGVLIWEASLNDVQQNLIGTDLSGKSDLGNVGAGVLIWDAPDNTIGSVGFGNVISGNDAQGVRIRAALSTGNQVQANMIGTDVTGSFGVGNSLAAVLISDASSNTLGGTVEGSANVISGNLRHGVGIVSLSGGLTSSNQLLGNLVGSDATGTILLGNGADGVIIENASDNVIGGTSDGAANLIAGNAEHGIEVFESTVGTTFGNRLSGNSIISNLGMGIDLADDGVTANDAGDRDQGPNLLQNYPTVTSADAIPASVTIDGTLDSLRSSDYRIEFFASTACDGSGCGEGERYLGFENVTTDASGNAAFNVSLAAPVSDSDSITATATDINDNTSEFSECIPANCLSVVVLGQSIQASDKETLAWPSVADVRFVNGDLAQVNSYGVIDDGTRMDATSLDISGDYPLSGRGFYYVVRPLGCGSWQNELGLQPERDLALP